MLAKPVVTLAERQTSSMAITTSTVSKLSSPRSLAKWELGLICLLDSFSNRSVHDSPENSHAEPLGHATNLAGIGNLEFIDLISHCMFLSGISLGLSFPTHLVEVLQEVDYATLNFLLLKTGSGGIETRRLEGEGGSDLRRTGNGRAADLEGGRGPDGTGHGSSQRADNGGTEHFEWRSEIYRRESLVRQQKKMRVKRGGGVDEGKRGSQQTAGRG